VKEAVGFSLSALCSPYNNHLKGFETKYQQYREISDISGIL
jgi:hypothetical protein